MGSKLWPPWQQQSLCHQVHCALSGVQSPSQVTQQHESQAIPGYQSPPNLRIPLVELTGILQGYSLHHPAGWNYPRNHQVLQAKASSSCIQNCGLLPVHGSSISTMQSARMYYSQHLLTLQRYPSHLHTRYWKRCHECDSFLMLRWFPDWAAAGDCGVRKFE